ncbi:hypothetical protein SNEBB_008539 [Seison nebaliae]|nr:hypothetical protein SNEBB_008539 [Seison nebaliae]
MSLSRQLVPLAKWNSIRRFHVLSSSLIISPCRPTEKFKRQFLIYPMVDRLLINDYRWISMGGKKLVINKDESKVEQSVKVLKEKKKKLPIIPSSLSEDGFKEEDKSLTKKKKSIGRRIIKEIIHYYHGTRLLFLEIRIATRSIWHVLNGRTLTRREKKQFTRTVADIFRLVPVIVIALIPFMEFLMPVIIRLFPNMLPSTFQEKSKEQEKLRKKLQLKLEMAKFLQDTMEETALTYRTNENKIPNRLTLQEKFSEFMKRVRSKGSMITNDEIIQFSKLFEDELTLDNLSRQQLLALCRIVEIPAMGTDTILRFQLKLKLRNLKVDDQLIKKEGLNNMTVNEVQQACRQRGMRYLGLSEDRLRHQLSDWLDLHLNHEIPISLLLLSRILYLSEHVPTDQEFNMIKDTLVQLPEHIETVTQMNIGEVTGQKVDNKTKLKLLKKEEAAIKEEKKVQKKLEEIEPTLIDNATELNQKEKILTSETIKSPTIPSTLQTEPTQPEHLEEKMKMDLLATEREEQRTKEKQMEEPSLIHAKEIKDLDTLMDSLSLDEHLTIQKNEIKMLKEDLDDHKREAKELLNILSGPDQMSKEEEHKKIILADHLVGLMRYQEEKEKREKEMEEKKKEEKEIGFKENKSVKILEKQINRLVTDLDLMVDQLSEKKERVKNQLHHNIPSYDQLSINDQSSDEIISIEEAAKRLHGMKGCSISLQKAQELLKNLDDDADGRINMNHVSSVLATLAQENVSVSESLLKDILNLLKKEHQIEEEQRHFQQIQRQLKKINRHEID